MQTLALLQQPAIEGALRRYVRAEALFEQACSTVLDDAGQITPAAQILETAEITMLVAMAELEKVLVQAITTHSEATLRMAHLLKEDEPPRRTRRSTPAARRRSPRPAGATRARRPLKSAL